MQLDEATLLDCLSKALEKRHALTDSNALRIVNGEGDLLPGLVIDRYNKHFQIQLYQAHWVSSLTLLQEWIASRWDISFLVVKWRVSPNGESLQNPRMEVLLNIENSKTIVSEGGLKFEVDLLDTVNPGLFLDMRANRILVSQFAKGKTVLNCFAYTCAFGMHCHAAGAKEVNNVDISAKALSKGRENYLLNKVEIEKYAFLRSDTRDYLKLAARKNLMYDIVIFDPPSFARTEKKVFQVERELPQLVEAGIELLKPKGRIFLSTNCSALSAIRLQEMLQSGSEKKKRKIVFQKQLGQDIDFPGSGMMRESNLSAIWTQFD